MKLEFDSDDMFVLGGTVCVLALIIALASCESVVESRLKERAAEAADKSKP